MSQPLLAFDTATLRTTVALASADGPPRVAPAEATRRHAAGLVPAIRDLLREAGLGVGDLAAVAVGLGPGSFTGLRVGLAAAKMFAYAAGIPLLGFDSLEAIARNAPEDALRVRVAADAQRGEFYVADFARTEVGATLERIGPTRIRATDDWLSSLQPGDFAIGPALERPALTMPESIRRGGTSRNHPDGLQLLTLAEEALRQDRCGDLWRIEPIYLRRSAAEEKLGA